MAQTPQASAIHAACFPRLAPDSYHTDGHRLLRVVDAGPGASTALEDCLTLEVRSYLPGQLAGLRLRSVGAKPRTPSTSRTTSTPRAPTPPTRPLFFP